MSMGKNTNTAPDLSGNLFDLIQNAELYSKRLQELKDAEAAAKAAEESFGLAQQGRLALNSAKAIRAAADEALATANGKAREIVESASREAKEIVDTAEATAAQTNEAVKKAQSTLDQLNASIGTIEDDIAKQREAAQKVAMAASKAMDEALALKAEYEDKAQKLKALL